MSVRNIIWQTSPGSQTDFEREYIEKILFSNIKFNNVIFDGKFSVLMENAIVILSQNEFSANERIVNYLNKLNNPVLLHLSGENLFPPQIIYSSASSIIRSYFDPRLKSSNIFSIPLGFKSGFMNQKSVINTERNLMWFFAGQIKSDRSIMLSVLEQMKPNFFYLTDSWESDKALSVSQMITYFTRSIFAPCPFGNINPDTFRVMESLEHGAIPVCIKFKGYDYFKFIFGDHPFILGEDWNDAFEKMKKLLGNSQKLIAKQKFVREWYQEFKNNLQLDIEQILNGTKENLVSQQFKYQIAGRLDKMLIDIYNAHFNKNFDKNTSL